MGKILRVAVLFAAMAVSGTAVSVTSAPAAEAQGMEYCRDLGVLVEHTGAGLLVRALRGNAAARQIGLRPFDIIFSINGSHPGSLSDLHRVLFTGGDDEDHDLDIFRGGQHVHSMVFHHDGNIMVHSALH